MVPWVGSAALTQCDQRSYCDGWLNVVDLEDPGDFCHHAGGPQQLFLAPIF